MRLVFTWMVRLALIALLCAAVIWVADHPGEAQIDWLGYRISAAFWVLALIFALSLAIFMGGAWMAMRAAYHVSLLRSNRAVKHQRKGIDALTDTITALCAHESEEAASALARSKKYLDEDLPLIWLLEAHIASRTDQSEAMLEALGKMQSAPQTAFIAKRSLGKIAAQDAKPKQALDYALEAYQMRPHHKKSLIEALGLLIQQKDYDQAQDMLQRSKKYHALSAEMMRHYQAMLYYLRAESLPEEARNSKTDLLARAFAADRSFVPAYDYIGVLYEQGKLRKAMQMLLKAWKTCPHPDLVDRMIAYFSDDQPSKLMKRGQMLVQMHPGHLESHIAMARISMAAQQWDNARNHLKAALSLSPQQRIYSLLAQLEEQDGDDMAAAGRWLKKMSDAQDDPVWYCAVSGAVYPRWQSHCVESGAFDSILWDVPQHHRSSGQDMLFLDKASVVS